MATNRSIIFSNGFIYHVYNRGIEKRITFRNKYEYMRATEAFRFYQYANIPMRLSRYLSLSKEDKLMFLNSVQSKLVKHVDIIAYCLMPNHFHFLLKQNIEDGIPRFIANFTNSYTKFFNVKENREGPLFQGVFKATFVETTEQLMHISRYIHLNPVVSSLVKAEDLQYYPWSSYQHYFDKDTNCFVNKDTVLEHFPSNKEYKQFVLDHVSYARDLEMIKHLSVDY